MTGTIETQEITRIRTINKDWADAITLWLNSRRSPATRRAYARALEDLFVCSNALPWEITRTHVIRWVQALAKAGNAPTTISQRLAGVSSFYRFTMEEYFVEETTQNPPTPPSASGKGGKMVSRTRPLHNQNPAIGKTLRPPIELYGKATWLDAEETKAFLKAIYRGTLQGARDYALFIGYVLLSRRNSEWRTATWGDFERHGEQVFYRWDGKGKKDQRIEVPMPVWYAVCDYLQMAGRLSNQNESPLAPPGNAPGAQAAFEKGGQSASSLKEMGQMKDGLASSTSSLTGSAPTGGLIQPDEHIFTALHRKNKPMPDGQLVEGNKALSSHEVGRLLKRYLSLAGLQGKRIRPHSLRHTGAMLRRACGASDQEIMQYLGHKNLAITQVYLHALAGKQDTHWMLVSELLDLNPLNPPLVPPSKKGGGKTFPTGGGKNSVVIR